MCARFDACKRQAQEGTTVQKEEYVSCQPVVPVGLLETLQRPGLKIHLQQQAQKHKSVFLYVSHDEVLQQVYVVEQT